MVTMVQSVTSGLAALISNKFRGVPFVTLYVGLERIPHHIHENLLFEASPVFEAAFSGKFRESSDRSMDLPDDDVDAAERMVRKL